MDCCRSDHRCANRWLADAAGFVPQSRPRARFTRITSSSGSGGPTRKSRAPARRQASIVPRSGARAMATMAASGLARPIGAAPRSSIRRRQTDDDVSRVQSVVVRVLCKHRADKLTLDTQSGGGGLRDSIVHAGAYDNTRIWAILDRFGNRLRVNLVSLELSWHDFPSHRCESRPKWPALAFGIAIDIAASVLYRDPP